MTNKILILLLIITLIVSSVIVVLIKKDAGIESFYIIDSSTGKTINRHDPEPSILKQTDDMDLYFVFILKNPHRNDRYRLTASKENDGHYTVLQTSTIPIDKEKTQKIEIAFAKRNDIYEKGNYQIELFRNESLIQSLSFHIR